MLTPEPSPCVLTALPAHPACWEEMAGHGTCELVSAQGRQDSLPDVVLWLNAVQLVWAVRAASVKPKPHRAEPQSLHKPLAHGAVRLCTMLGQATSFCGVQCHLSRE